MSTVRKYDSGYQKRKKKKRIEELIQSQKGSLDKFVIKESQTSVENEHIDVNLADTNVNASNENPSGGLDDINVNANNASNDILDASDGDDATNVDDHFDIFDILVTPYH